MLCKLEVSRPFTVTCRLVDDHTLNTLKEGKFFNSTPEVYLTHAHQLYTVNTKWSMWMSGGMLKILCDIICLLIKGYTCTCIVLVGIKFCGFYI